MARETRVIVDAWCDARHAPRVEATNPEPIVIRLNGQEVEVDLCDTCQKEFIDPLMPVFEFGRKPALVQRVTGPPIRAGKSHRRARGTGPWTCPECGAGLTHRGNLNAHLLNQHKMTDRDLRLAKVAIVAETVDE